MQLNFRKCSFFPQVRGESHIRLSLEGCQYKPKSDLLNVSDCQSLEECFG